MRQTTFIFACTMIAGMAALASAQERKQPGVAARFRSPIPMPQSSAVLTEQVPRSGPVPTPHPQVEELPGPAGAVAPRPGAYVLPVRYPTHAEFARSFQPLPGNYEVVLSHPFTCRPVKICFTLPNCCLQKTRVERGELEFDYGKVEVELRFKRDGRVNVEYRD